MVLTYNGAYMANSRARLPSGQSLKSYRHQIALLKKKGLVRSNYDVRHAKVTRTMLDKIERYKGVLSGEEVVRTVRNKKIRDYYKEHPTDYIKPGIGNKVVVRNEKEYTQQVRKGIVQGIRKLKNGERIKVKLPLKSLDDLLHNPIWNELKKDEDYFTYNFYGNEGKAYAENLEDLYVVLAGYRAFETAETNQIPFLEIIRTNTISPVVSNEVYRERSRTRRRERARVVKDENRDRLNMLRRQRYERWSINNPDKHEVYLEKQRKRMKRLRNKEK